MQLFPEPLRGSLNFVYVYRVLFGRHLELLGFGLSLLGCHITFEHLHEPSASFCIVHILFYMIILFVLRLVPCDINYLTAKFTKYIVKIASVTKKAPIKAFPVFYLN